MHAHRVLLSMLCLLVMPGLARAATCTFDLSGETGPLDIWYGEVAGPYVCTDDGSTVACAEPKECIGWGSGDVVLIIGTAASDQIWPCHMSSPCWVGDCEIAEDGDWTLEIRGGDGDDNLWGRNGGVDWLYGEDDADQIRGDGGTDYIYGGSGDDIWLYGMNGDDAVFGDDGCDRVFGGSGNDWVFVGSDYTDDGCAGVQHALGDYGNDLVVGSYSTDLLEGGYGDDTIWGLSGDDCILGCDYVHDICSTGDQDTMYGGADEDSLCDIDNSDDEFDGGDQGAIFQDNDHASDYFINATLDLTACSCVEWF